MFKISPIVMIEDVLQSRVLTCTKKGFLIHLNDTNEYTSFNIGVT